MSLDVKIIRDPRLREHGQIIATCVECGVRTYIAGGPGRVVLLPAKPVGKLHPTLLMEALLAHEGCAADPEWEDYKRRNPGEPRRITPRHVDELRSPGALRRVCATHGSEPCTCGQTIE